MSPPIVITIDDADQPEPGLAVIVIQNLIERVDGQVLVVAVVNPDSGQMSALTSLPRYGLPRRPGPRQDPAGRADLVVRPLLLVTDELLYSARIATRVNGTNSLSGGHLPKGGNMREERTERTSRLGWLGTYALVFLASVTVMVLGGAGTALAAAKPASAPRAVVGGGGMTVGGAGTALAAAKPASAPQSIVGGGGYEYSASEEGNCGVSAIGVNDNGGGKLSSQAQLISTLGTIVDGSVTIIWSGGGKSGSKSWQPRGVNWISPVTNFDVPQHKDITVLVTGYVVTSEGDDCSIENPHVTFKSS